MRGGGGGGNTNIDATGEKLQMQNDFKRRKEHKASYADAVNTTHRTVQLE